MKLADLDYPLTPDALHHFKITKKYGMVEAGMKTNVPNILELIQCCLNDLRVKNCVEFAFNKIEYRYHIMEDEHEWTVSLIGFMPLN